MKARVPEIGRLVEYSSMFEKDRTIGIVINVPTQEEVEIMFNRLRPESTYTPDVCFEVLVNGEVEYWSEWEWNYIDTEDVEKKE